MVQLNTKVADVAVMLGVSMKMLRENNYTEHCSVGPIKLIGAMTTSMTTIPP